MLKRILSLLIIALLSATILNGCSEPVPRREEFSKPISIGLILPLKGDFSAFGILCKNAIDLFVDEVNSKGGVLGQKIKAIPGDDASSPNVAKHAAKQYTQAHKVSAIVGPYTTQSSLQAAPIANEDKVPLVAIRASEPSVTKAGEYVFRACYVETYQGTLLGKFAGRDLTAKTAAVVYNEADEGALALIEDFKRELKKSGGKVVSVQSYGRDAVDFTTQLKELARVNPDVVLLTDFEDKAGLIIKKASAMGLKSKFLGTDFWNVENLLKIAGKAAIGSYFSSHFSPEDPDERVQDFVELYAGDYGVKPGPSAALSYDAISLVVEAITRARSTDPKKIKEALAKIKNFKGVTGTFSFDKDRNPIKGGVILKVVEGGQAFEKRIEP